MRLQSKQNDMSFKAKRSATEAEIPLKIGEVAKQSGVGIETLRFYERTGLLGRPARTQSGYRLYDPEVLERLDFIKRAQVLGFSLDEIRQIIAEKQAGGSPCQAVRDVVRTRLAELDEHMREMGRYRNELAATLKEWDRAGDVKGHICGLIEGTTMKHHLSTSETSRRRKLSRR